MLAVLDQWGTENELIQEFPSLNSVLRALGFLEQPLSFPEVTINLFAGEVRNLLPGYFKMLLHWVFYFSLFAWCYTLKSLFSALIGIYFRAVWEPSEYIQVHCFDTRKKKGREGRKDCNMVMLEGLYVLLMGRSSLLLHLPLSSVHSVRPNSSFPFSSPFHFPWAISQRQAALPTSIVFYPSYQASDPMAEREKSRESLHLPSSKPRADL